MTTDLRFTRRGFVTNSAFGLMGAVFGAPRYGLAGQASTSAGPADPKLIENLVAANRILVDQGVLDGYGHVSARHDRDPNRYLLSRSLAPELVTAADIMEYDLESNPINAGGASMYMERFIHGEIYRARPDVKAIVHNHAPSGVLFGVSGIPLRPIYHMAAFLWEGVPVFEIRKAAGMTGMLIRNQELGRALAQTLGSKPAALMRGHGAVVVGRSLIIAAAHSIYLELNAKLQAQAMSMSRNINYLDAKEAQNVIAEGEHGGYERAWDSWKRKAMPKQTP